MDCQNHVPVEVTQICGPNHFWVVPLKEEKNDVEKRIWLRREMRHHFQRENTMEDLEDLERMVYRKGDFVAVLWEEMWERARFESVSEQGFGGEHQYVDVFLIDKGKKVKVSDIPSNVRPILNNSLLHIEAQAKEFLLIGLTPISKDFDYLESKMKNIVTAKWSELSQVLVQDLLRLCEGINIQVSHKEDMNDSRIFKRLYGKMFLNMNIGQPSRITRLIEKYADKKIYYKKYFIQNDPEMISVTQMLIKGRFCIDQRNENLKKSESDKENQVQEKKKPNVKNENVFSSNYRLAHGPSEEIRERKLTEQNKSLVSTPYTSSVQRLMQWPLQEDVREEKKPLPPVLDSQNDDTNESSLFITAEGSSLNPDQSIILAGNEPSLGIVKEARKVEHQTKIQHKSKENSISQRTSESMPMQATKRKPNEIESITGRSTSDPLRLGSDIERSKAETSSNVRQKSLISFNCQSTKFVLCHGDNGSRRIKPILSIDGFPKTFDKRLKAVLLSKKVESATKFQEYMWPIVSKTYSLVAIGPQGSGKSYGYLIPMVDTILRTLEESRVKLRKISNTAPLAVILCPSWKVVLQTEEMLKTIEKELKHNLGRTALQGQFLRILAIYEGEHKLKQNVALINGCHILITTPPSLLRMLSLPQQQTDIQGNLKGTNLEMCSHLVFENADQTFEKYDVEIARLMLLFKASRLKEKERMDKMNNNSSVEMFDQFIITSRKWVNSLEKFVNTFIVGTDKVGPYFLFYDNLEAAVYGKAKIASHLLEDSQSKLRKIKDIIYSYPLRARRKILIHTNSEAGVLNLSAFLENNSDGSPKIVPFFLPTKETSALQTREILSIWRQTSENDNLNEYYPLIIADSQDVEPLELFQTNNYCQEDVMIMSDLPENSKKNFAQRFSHISNSFRSFYTDEAVAKDEKENPLCHILIIPEDRDKLKSIYMFLKRVSTQQMEANTVLPDNLTDLYRRFQEEDARKKSGEDLCLNLKMFGRCKDKRMCTFRHYIVPMSDIETSVIAKENIRNDDADVDCDEAYTMEYDVVTVVSASYYYVRLRRSKNKSGKIVRDFSKSYIRLGMKLGSLDEKDLDEMNKEELEKLSRNYLVLVRDKDNFKRAKFLSKGNKKDTSKCLLVDEGKMIAISNSKKFWKIPIQIQNLQRYPIHAAEVILLGVAPCDKDNEWPELPCRIIKKGLLSVHRQNVKDNGSAESGEEAIDTQELQNEEEEREIICRSKCALILGNTIWVKQVQLSEKLRSHDIDADGKISCHYASSWTPIFEAKDRLLKKNLAEENSGHVPDLLEICKTANLPTKIGEKLSLLSASALNNPFQIVASDKSTDNQQIELPKLPKGDKNVNEPGNSLVSCPQTIRKCYLASKSELILNHQRAHLNADLELSDLSDTGLPNEREVELHAKNSNMPASELLLQFKLIKLKKKIDSSTDNLVVITYVYNPSCFYIRHAKYSRQLCALEKEITEFAEQAKILHSANNMKYEDGRICIGRQLSTPLKDKNVQGEEMELDPGKDVFEYKRVQILRHTTKEDEEWERDPMDNFRYLDGGDENESDGYLSEEDIRIETSNYTVIFVDYGYQKVMSAHDLMPIPKIFVEKLPLQAIECALLNIEPTTEIKDNWPDQANELLKNVATLKDTFFEGNRRLVCNVKQMQFKAQSVTKFPSDSGVICETDCPVGYWVRLFPLEGGDHLGMQLIKSGLAISVDDNEVMLNYDEDSEKNFNITKEEDEPEVDPEMRNATDTNQLNKEVKKPVQNDGPKIPLSDMTTSKVLQYKSLVIPAGLPGLCIDQNSGQDVYVKILPQFVTWSQNKDKTNVSLKIQLDLMYDQEACINKAFLSVQSRSIEFEYLEIAHIRDGVEEYRHHKLPTLDLYGTVNPQKTEVKFSGKQVIIKLSKVNNCFWQQASIDTNTGKPKKLFWIKHDNELGWDSTSNDSDTDTESCAKPIELGNHKRKIRSKAASKIRQTLDQYPKPSSFADAKNFDDSTDHIDEFRSPSDGSIDSDNELQELAGGVESMNKNTMAKNRTIKGLYMNPNKCPVIYDPDVSNYIQ